MKLVFCGTPQFAVATLERLVERGHEVELVVTQPDRPRGRGMEVAYSPVKQSALKMGLAVAQPEKIKTNSEFRAQLEAIGPQAIIVVGYGRIIPQWMMELASLGNLNVHASLLPKYRGAAPIQWAIAMGETVTGVTIMRIDAGLDTGDILAQAEESIRSDDTALTLGPRLAELGAELMADTLPKLERGEITPRKQDDARATLAPILKKEDGLLDFRRTARENLNRLRGFQPWPGAYTTFRGKMMTVHSARAHEKAGKSLTEGEIGAVGESLLVGCGRGSALELLEVQLEGKKRMSARDFVNGYRPQPGEMLGVQSINSASTPSTTH
jgi:methionyl-tRNA formyltransferase